MDESLDEAAARELKEETNLENIPMEQFYAWGAVNRDPRMRVISVSYAAVIPKGQVIPAAGDDAASANWYTIDYQEQDGRMKVVLNCEQEEIVFFEDENRKIIYQSGRLAFDHGEIIICAIRYLLHRQKL